MGLLYLLQEAKEDLYLVVGVPGAGSGAAAAVDRVAEGCTETGDVTDSGAVEVGGDGAIGVAAATGCVPAVVRCRVCRLCHWRWW